jgi:hypothetical protein
VRTRQQQHEGVKRRRGWLSLGQRKRIVGIVEVIGEHRPDPTDETGASAWSM